MSSLFESLIGLYATRGLLVDTNILLLYCVGAADRSLIGRKRLSGFTSGDFDLLTRVVSLFSKIVTTPNIVTEVSNLAGQLANTRGNRCMKKLAEQVQMLDERYTPSQELARAGPFEKFGLTDSGIAHSAAGRFLVLTDDFALWYFLSKRQVDAINFNHLREVAGTLDP